MENTRIGVIGAGSWGTTLANLLAEKGFEITLWVYEKDLQEIIKERRENPFYLPKIRLSEAILPTNSLEEASRDKEIILCVLPSFAVRGVISQVIPYLSPETIIVSATKGMELRSSKFISEVLLELLPSNLHKNLACLSGPTFALEVSQRLPTVCLVASKVRKIAKKLQHILATPYFRVYTASDLKGVELGGVFKNVIAIAVGVSDGLGLGYNARAALITRGLAEMIRLGKRLGANPSTFSGLSGIGDLVLTSTSELSRNKTLGIKLGKGKRLEEILSETRMVTEGVNTTKGIYNLSKKLGVEMPITEELYLLLYENKPPKQAVIDLMNRELKDEKVF